MWQNYPVNRTGGTACMLKQRMKNLFTVRVIKLLFCRTHVYCIFLIVNPVGCDFLVAVAAVVVCIRPPPFLVHRLTVVVPEGLSDGSSPPGLVPSCTRRHTAQKSPRQLNQIAVLILIGTQTRLRRQRKRQ